MGETTEQRRKKKDLGEEEGHGFTFPLFFPRLPLYENIQIMTYLHKIFSPFK
jgi:hypothetical protein